ncbi:SCO family protein [Geomesophilobacter sediminis]|uniref:SCO family protein n=1 Tax=Geomesophilobacter sediminis TaxID=2798584 RepID=A0A8J7LZ52_9BACT|nr:SCO family protein [Geomesophilobacter sediminis]MBJ6726142.1 SCO family protein [Geomesophilobacter sediminis]
MTRTLKLLRAAVMSLLIFPGTLLAHEHGKGHPAASGPAAAATAEAGVGLDEKLGARIPLDLTFRDETGKQVRLGELITGPTIVVPVYFGCSNVCNFLQGGLARVLPSVNFKPGTDYRVISVSIDETEGPEIASRFQKTYLTAMDGAFPAAGWRFLTGDATNIRRLTDAAGYRFKRQDHDFIHPVASFVVTGDGMIVRYLYGTTFMAKDLTLALIEAQRGQVGATIRKMVGYCFRFDPATRSYQFNLLRVSATVIILCTGSFLAYLVFGGKSRRRKISGEK